MARPAERMRQRAQEIWPGAVVHSRGKNWIRHQHPTDPNRFMLDASIGAIHYGASLDQEIDTAWQPSSGQWLYQMLASDFNAWINNGTFRYQDIANGENIELDVTALEWINDAGQTQNIPLGVFSQSVNDDELTWNDLFGIGTRLKVQVQTARLAKKLEIDTLASLPVPILSGNVYLSMRFRFRRSNNVRLWIDGVEWNENTNNPRITSNNVEFRLVTTGEVIWWFKTPHAHDSPPDDVNSPQSEGSMRLRKSGNNLFVEARIPYTWMQAAFFPIVIDPTIDKTVASSAGDADEVSTGASILTNTPSNINDATNEWFGAWWDISDAPIPSGATITACTVTCEFPAAANDEPDHPMYFHEAANPAIFSAGAAGSNLISGRPRTTATVTWSNANLGAPGDFTCPDMSAVLQEVVDSQGQLSAIAWLVNGSASSTRDFQVTTYDGSTTLCPRLHIVYTSTSTLSINVTDNVTIGESTTVDPLVIPGIVITDNITIGESTLMHMGLEILAADNITLGDSASIDPLALAGINVTDNVTVGDSASLYMGIDISVADNVTVADSVSIDPLALNVIASDNVTVSESQAVQVSDPQITVTDNVSVGDSANVTIATGITDLDITVSDNVTVGDSAQLYMGIDISVVENVTVGESTIIDPLGINVTVSDAVTVGESQTLQVSDPQITVSDNITVGDSANVAIVSTFDLQIAVTDNITVAESQVVQVSDPQITVSDGVIVGDSASVSIVSVSDLTILVSDNILVSDAATVSLGDLRITVTDGITIAESAQLYMGIGILVSDNIVVTDAALLSLGDLSINVSDAIIVGESAFVSIVTPVAGLALYAHYKGMYRGSGRKMR